jgi:hypothetical protein
VKAEAARASIHGEVPGALLNARSTVDRFLLNVDVDNAQRDAAAGCGRRVRS